MKFIGYSFCLFFFLNIFFQVFIFKLEETTAIEYDEQTFINEVVRRYELNNPWTNQTNPPYTCVSRAEDLHAIFGYLGIFSQIQVGYTDEINGSGHVWVEQCDSYLVDDREKFPFHKQVR